jgi:hypothetical protein
MEIADVIKHRPILSSLIFNISYRDYVHLFKQTSKNFTDTVRNFDPNAFKQISELGMTVMISRLLSPGVLLFPQIYTHVSEYDYKDWVVSDMKWYRKEICLTGQSKFLNTVSRINGNTKVYYLKFDLNPYINKIEIYRSRKSSFDRSVWSTRMTGMEILDLIQRKCVYPLFNFPNIEAITPQHYQKL